MSLNYKTELFCVRFLKNIAIGLLTYLIEVKTENVRKCPTFHSVTKKKHFSINQRSLIIKVINELRFRLLPTTTFSLSFLCKVLYISAMLIICYSCVNRMLIVYANQVNHFIGAMKSSAHVISGDISLGTQHHFHMETHVSACLI